MSVVIKIENLSKQYRLGLVSTRTLSHDINRWYQMNVRRKEDPYLKIGEVNYTSAKDNSNYVWALCDINLEVHEGEALGIIGKNGAGKSTLLKILSKVTAPTTGTIKAKGRIASLLEVGTGFHPEMTGRENIFMNGAIMGMTKTEIAHRFDEIVDFSGVERYIDTPVKRYSSGMTVRLGFAVAAHLEPEILVVDEVLAVGDAEFQKKAIGKMQDISKGEGRTVLFVTHNMAAVQNICKKTVLIENGKVISIGNTKETISNYLISNFNDFSCSKGIFNFKKHLSKKNSQNGINYAELYCNGQLSNTIIPGSLFEIKIFYESDRDFYEGEIGIAIKDSNDICYIGLNNKHLGQNINIAKGKGIGIITIDDFPLYASGNYWINLYFGDQGPNYEILENAIKFEVRGEDLDTLGRKLDDNWNKIIHKKIKIITK